ncbi:MAG: O-methyltransferase [Terriglobales bacterium]
MRHPPYPLRTNKAVDRFMLIEAIRQLGKPTELAQYTYYGLGGPYLEDFRSLHESFPELKMVSFERNAETIKQQRFHQPCGPIQIRHVDVTSFIARYDSKNKKSIFWLDYDKLVYSQFDDFMTLLGKVAPDSIVKITLRAEPSDYLGNDAKDREKKDDEFRRKFSAVLPRSDVTPPPELEKFAGLLQEMAQVAAQKALPSGTGFAYQPISSFCYKDGAGIFTLTGIVSERSRLRSVRSRFSSLKVANLDWAEPKLIDVPFLSTKERLHLQKHLPCVGDAGRKLLRVLGYRIDNDRPSAVAKMKQYADFYRYYPHFVRAIP